MKKILSVLLCITFILCLSGCTYNPPDGWTKKHHTYDEVLSFARTIDPNATVSEEYNDTVDEYDWEFREWDAIINGVECHVASVSDWVCEYTKQAIERKAGFSIPSPGKYYNQGDDEYIIKNDSHAYIEEFTEEGKKAFLQEYKEDWALLESGLPIED